MKSDPVTQQAKSLIRLNRLEDAFLLLNKARISQPRSEHWQAWSRTLCWVCNSIGGTFLSKGQEKLGLVLLKWAESLADRGSGMRATVLDNLACYYRRVGKPRLALMYLEKMNRIASESLPVTSLATTHLNYCLILSELGQHTEALMHAMEAVVMLQNDFIRNRLLGLCYSEDKIEVLAFAYHNYAAELEFRQRVRGR